MPEITERFFAADRKAWRGWLRRYGRSKQEVWLVLFKKKHVERTGEACVSYDEAVEEALCFGWIDGIRKRIDDREHVIRFSPRRARSVWSVSNKERVARLVRQRKMTKVGLAAVEAGKRSGAWDRAEARQLELQTAPEDLQRALARNKRAQAAFAAFTPSQRRSYVHWVLDAKRSETRLRRIREVVRRSARNIKPGIDM